MAGLEESIQMLITNIFFLMLIPCSPWLCLLSFYLLEMHIEKKIIRTELINEKTSVLEQHT